MATLTDSERDDLLSFATHNKINSFRRLVQRIAEEQDLGEETSSVFTVPKTQERKTVLIAAAENCSKDIVLYCAEPEMYGGREDDMEKFADTQDMYGKTALMAAAVRGGIEIVDALLGMRSSPNLVDKDGFGFLHCAVVSGNTELVDSLCGSYVRERWLRINQPIRDGSTALHIASWEDDADMVLCLLKHGADHAMADDFGYTVRMWAERQNKREVLSVLDAAGVTK